MSNYNRDKNGNPMFSWAEIDQFRTLVLANGGSSDVQSGRQIDSDLDLDGRYARQYSRDLTDQPGRTISFWCAVDRPIAKYGSPGYFYAVVLTGCPWGTAEERDATYRALAASGCRPNDMREDAALMDLVAQAKTRYTC